MPHLRLFLFVILLAILTSCASAPRTTGPSADVAAIQKVVETFRTAIITKDKPAFLQLFFSDTVEQVTWQAVVDDPSLQRIRKDRPQAIKARHRPDNNHVAFINGIVSGTDREEETFSDIHIDTDGEIASVSFDYVFLVNGSATNSGREKWLLVRTEQGWKIISVVYTIRLA